MTGDHPSADAPEGWVVTLDARDAEARAVLVGDRIWNCFALADLRPPFRGYTQIATARHRDSGQVAASLLVRHPAFVVVSPYGDAEGVSMLLDRIELPPVALIQSLEAHLPVIGRSYRPRSDWSTMLRMATNAERFRPPQASTAALASRLGPDDLADMRALYARSPGSHFRDDLLDTDSFYGIHVDGQLVAIGGTHVVDQPDGIAVLGNIFTHPAHRGRGYAHAVTAALVSELLARGCADVVLNVYADNTPAIHVYRDLGFHEAHRYLSGEADRLT